MPAASGTIAFAAAGSFDAVGPLSLERGLVPPAAVDAPGLDVAEVPGLLPAAASAGTVTRMQHSAEQVSESAPSTSCTTSQLLAAQAPPVPATVLPGGA